MNTKKPLRHPPMKQFETEGDELVVNGHSLSSLVALAGQTPFYVYDRSVIQAKVNQFRQKMPDWLKLHYAVKANPMPELVSYMVGLTDGLDVASGKELQLAINAGAAPGQISFAGPGKTDQELAMALATGITLNVESCNELLRLKSLCQQTAQKARVALRVNPDFELKSSGMKMGGGAQQFGIDAESIPQAFSLFDEEWFDFIGFHIFSGSQNLRAESIIQAHQGIFALAEQLQKHAPSPIQKLNIGGGLGIPYFPGETTISLDPIAQNLQSLKAQYAATLSDAEIAMELGRFLVGESGLYVCRVLDIKKSRGQQFAVVDGGLHHHLAASGNFGQVVRKNYPVAIANKMQQACDTRTQVVGPLCTPLDILASQYDLPPIEPGDLFVVYQSGAYGYSASPQRFLSHPEPIELLI